MKRLSTMVLAAAMCFGAMTASAADLMPVAPMPVKASGLAPFANFDCSTASYCVGPTIGVHMTGLNSKVDVLGGGLNGSLGAGGMAGGVEVGFQAWNGNYFIAGTIGADIDFNRSTNIAGDTPLSGTLVMEKLKVGMNLAGAFGLNQASVSSPAPSASGPLSNLLLPTDFLKSMTSMYLVIGSAQRSHIGSGMLTGAGMQVLLAANVTAEAEYNHIDWSKAVNFGSIPGDVKTEDRVMAGLTYHIK